MANGLFFTRMMSSRVKSGAKGFDFYWWVTMGGVNSDIISMLLVQVQEGRSAFHSSDPV